MGLLGLLQGHAKPLIERHFLALAGIVTTFYPYLEATPCLLMVLALRQDLI